jgi:hypothetical protein
METQVNPAESVDPIQSFGDTAMEDQIEDMPTPKPLKTAQKKKDVVDRGLQCECDVVVCAMCLPSPCRFSLHFRSTTTAASARAVDAGIIYGQSLVIRFFFRCSCMIRCMGYEVRMVCCLLG